MFSLTRSRVPTCTISGSRKGCRDSSCRAGHTGCFRQGGLCSSQRTRRVRRLGSSGLTDCGVVVPPGRPELVAGVIRDAYEGRLDLEGMGARGRAYAEQNADRSVAISRYRELLGELLPSNGRRAQIAPSSD